MNEQSSGNEACAKETSAMEADLIWLASAEGSAAIAQAEQSTRPLHLELAALRKRFGPTRASLAIAQADLRRKAVVKFGAQAASLLWTDKLLQQATDRPIAEYKATRFGPGLLYDLCCGAGGDLFALARRGPVVGVDMSASALLLAQENARRLSLEISFIAGDAAAAPVADADAWHIDPDRRITKGRTSQLAYSSPDLASLRALLAQNQNAAIKCAPADRENELVGPEIEMEWIGSRGECRQLVLWSGKLARHPGKRVATVVEHGATHSFAGQPRAPIQIGHALGRYIHEPHNAVLGAELENDLANSLHQLGVHERAAYFTSDLPSPHPAMASYRIVEILPLDLKLVNAYVTARQIGVLEIKKRGVELDPSKMRQNLNLSGKNTATLILTPFQEKKYAIVAELENLPA